MAHDECEKLVGEGAMDVPAACQFSGLGRSYLYARMDAGDLKYLKTGRRRLIPKVELVRFLAASMVGAGK
jgi:excisionase family DNA binding protein